MSNGSKKNCILQEISTKSTEKNPEKKEEKKEKKEEKEEIKKRQENMSYIDKPIYDLDNKVYGQDVNKIRHLSSENNSKNALSRHSCQ